MTSHPPPGSHDVSPASDPILAAAFRTSRDAMILFRAGDELIVDVNDVWCATTGYRRDDVIGRSQRTLRIWEDPRDSERFAAALRDTDVVRGFRFGFNRREPNGRQSRGQAELTAQRIVLDGIEYVLVVGRDVTAEAMADARQQQTRRLEELGRLAGGIAHDFNNMLTIVRAYTSLVQRAVQDGRPPAVGDVAEIERATERAAAMTRRLLAFSRQRAVEPQVVDLNALIGEEVNMLARLIGDDITLRFEPAAALPAVLADPAQVEQVLVNLLVNARDAMPDGGCVTIRTGTADGPPPDESDGDGTERGFVVLEVEDNGVGMDDETVERIFEPFFTTKSPEHGTGLGLAMVQGIVRQAGGTVVVQSAPAHGTTFRLLWPRTELEPLPAADESPAAARRDDAGRVLLVEDDDEVRIAVCRLLKAAGYRVLEARNGAEALHALTRTADEPVDIVLTDDVMPVMGGRELARRLQATAPALVVVVMSGYADREAAEPDERAPDGWLSKPFGAVALLRALRAADASRAALRQRFVARGP